MMVVLGAGGRRNTHDSEKEIEVDSPYHGEEDKMEGDDENDSDDEQKCKEILTPLWNSVTRLGVGKGGGTKKFTCLHCHKTHIGFYTHVRKHLCGIMPWDEGKSTEVRTCLQVPTKDRIKYPKEEEVA